MKVLHSLTQGIFDVSCFKRRSNSCVYLTFDDGPHPIVTPWVLDQLKTQNAKATFFCVGANILKYPEVFKRILSEGHSVGNHSQNHEHGWKTSTKKYLQSIAKCNELTKSSLFRPPYGKLNFKQYKKLKNQYKMVLWDVLSKDYSSKITPKKCFKRIVKKTKAGSIIVFHDSDKAYKNLQYCLPKTLEYLSKLRLEMKSL